MDEEKLLPAGNLFSVKEHFGNRIDDSRPAEVFAREVLAMLVCKKLLSPEWAERILSWRHTGFNVHSLVRANGYVSHFYKMTVTYYDYNGHTYWHMENITNRCDERDTYHRREKDGRLPTF